MAVGLEKHTKVRPVRPMAAAVAGSLAQAAIPAPATGVTRCIEDIIGGLNCLERAGTEVYRSVCAKGETEPVLPALMTLMNSGMSALVQAERGGKLRRLHEAVIEAVLGDARSTLPALQQPPCKDSLDLVMVRLRDLRTSLPR